MAKEYPLISVIIPTIGRDTLEKSLYSILKSGYPNLDIIVSFNNCKLDRVDEMITEFPEIQFIYTKEKLFPAQAKNRALELAKGKFVTFIDDDDLCLPAKFFALSDYLEKNENTFATFGQYNAQDTQGNIINTNCGGHDNVCFDTLIEINYIASCSIMYKNHPDVRFDDVDYGFGEDWMMNLKLISKYKFSHIKIPVYIWTACNGFTKSLNEQGINWHKLVEKNKKKAIKLWKK